MDLAKTKTHFAQRAQEGSSLVHFRFPFLQFQQTCEASEVLSAILSRLLRREAQRDGEEGRQVPGS
jgi:hypothetical protein